MRSELQQLIDVIRLRSPRLIVDVDCEDGSLSRVIHAGMRGEGVPAADRGGQAASLCFIGNDRERLERSAVEAPGVRVLYTAEDVRVPEAVVEALRRGGVPVGPGMVYVTERPDSALDRDRRSGGVDPSPWLESWSRVAEGSQLVVALRRGSGSAPGHRATELREFVDRAGRAGLFEDGAAAVTLRDQEAPEAMSLCLLTRRDYRIRCARDSDLNALVELERLCWKNSRSSRARLAGRLRRYPDGQQVVERDGCVLGAIYSQRITHVRRLQGRRADNVDELHDPEGSIIQLLAINIHPNVQDLGLGDQLLEFTLRRSALTRGVRTVVGVTKCKNYHANDSLPLERYIRLKGEAEDPILGLHRRHGAKVAGLIAGYRPHDRINLGSGVLVTYDLRARAGKSYKAADRNPRRDEGRDVDRDAFVRYLRVRVATLLREDASVIDADRPIMEMGLDSADLLKLQVDLESRFDVRLQTGFFFQHSTINRVVAALAERFGDTTDGPSTDDGVHAAAAGSRRARGVSRKARMPLRRRRPSARKVGSRDVAVVGISCRLPGGITCPGELWKALASSRSLIGSYPRWRGAWPSGTESPGIDRGGFIEDGAAFDAAFFRVSPLEARLMDPQQRILLELAWSSLEDAGQVPEELRGRRVGVFVGASGCDYARLCQAAGVPPQAHLATGSSLAVLANRISYFFDFTGPSVVIDTACSSSLIAVHAAVASLRSGECRSALACGVNFICHSDLSREYYSAGMLSPDGACKTFDARANGYVRAEGAVVMLLQPLDDAVSEGLPIHAVIKGSATNHGGMASGLTVPNPKQQSELLRAAWRDAGISGDLLTLIEAHGTGTALGDPLEIEGIQTALAAGAMDGPKLGCAVGSLKSNLGHLEAAAGIAGLLKVILSLQRREIPATINFDRLNPKIALHGSGLHVADKSAPWESEGPRLGGVSSFGSGGANAHVVLEEYPQARNDAAYRSRHLFVLSAADRERLREYVSTVIDWLGECKDGGDFADAIYTWQVGRAGMKERLAAVVADPAELRVKLRSWLSRDQQVSGVWSSGSPAPLPMREDSVGTQPGSEWVEKAVRRENLESLAMAWTSGLAIGWEQLYENSTATGSKPRRMSLPTYPFARERYWLEEATGVEEAGRGVGRLHPLVQENTSDLGGQSYESRFEGEEFFLRDHRVRVAGEQQAQRVLPAVAYLEMAREAIERAWPEAREGKVLELRETVWVQPLVVEEGVGRRVGIGLSEQEEGEVEYEVYSEAMQGSQPSGELSEEPRVHCRGRGAYVAAQAPERVALERLGERMSRGRMEATQLYEVLEGLGLCYGETHRGVQELELGEGELLARLSLPAGCEQWDEYVLHPSLMDAALQASVGLLSGWTGQGQVLLPYALESVRIVRRCERRMLAWVRVAGDEGSGSPGKVDIELCDEQGEVCVQLRGLVARAQGKAVQAQAPGSALSAGSSATETSEPESDASEPESEEGVVWAAGQWREEAAGTVRESFVQRQVWLCDLAQVQPQRLEQLLPGRRCERVQVSEQKAGGHRYIEHALGCFERVKGLLQGKPGGRVLVQIVAPGAAGAGYAGLSGLLKTAGQENPQLRGQVILVPEGIGSEELARRLRQEQGQAELVRYEGGVRQVLGWQERRWEGERSPVVFKENGVYLISGGLGGLGVLCAREILRRTGQGRVVLMGRSALTEQGRTLMREMSGGDGRVQYRQADVTQREQIRELLQGLRQEYGRIDGILHAAGVLADEYILRKSGEGFREVLGPKVLGTESLDLASRGMELDFLVLFSSIAAVMGNVGQADYATGNGYMDGYAQYRNELVRQGQCQGMTVSINWPLWEEGGMRMEAANREWLRQQTGLVALGTREGLEALQGSLGLQADRVLVLQGRRRRLRELLGLGTGAAAVRRAPEAAQRAQAVAAEAEEAEGVEQKKKEEWVGSGPQGAQDLQERVEEYLRGELSRVLQLPAQRIEVSAQLERYGIDSILALSLTRELEKSFGPLSKTLLFEYRSLRELGGYLVQSHGRKVRELFAGSAAAESGPQERSSVGEVRVRAVRSPRRSGRRLALQGAREAREGEPIAIIGLSGRYPQALDLEQYWQNLREGKDCISEVPVQRWDWRRYYSADRSREGCHYSKWGGFIEGVDEFDPLFFNISPREAKYLDPQERLFLQHAWQAVEDAGYTRAGLQVPNEQDLAGQVGVYVGVMYSEYQLFGAEASLRGRRVGLAGSFASVANRVSYTLNLHGPSMTLDTMCSSSLTAIHVACQDLRLGRTAAAIAGGVNVSIHPNKYLMLSAGQFISSDGHCQSFGEGGDGYIPGEGVGAVVLKRLSDAQRDGDQIYGVILGSALTHGGKTNGYTVPNPQAQSSAIARALREARVSARQIGYIEAHGTGTKLGDPIEIAALSQAFAKDCAERGFCLIGSAKSNIGHCEAAAGIAGLTKVLLQMRHGEIVPSLHAQRLNPHIDFSSTPFEVNQELRPWERRRIEGRESERLAGISSFGAGGSNAHMIIREYRDGEGGEAAGQRPGGERVMVPLSARTQPQLHERAQQLLRWLERPGQQIDLRELAYTLQVGREGMDERVGLMADSLEQLRQKLQGYVQGQEQIEELYRGQVRRDQEGMSLISEDEDMREAVRKWMARGKRGKLLELWVKGLEVDWRQLYGPRAPRRMSLPTYPFARERYWLEEATGVEEAGRGVGRLHPLVQENTSDLGGQSYESRFEGEEFFLRDHRVRVAGEQQAQRVLPAVAYLEMAREAIERAWPEAREGKVLELRETVWVQPLVVEEGVGRRVGIGLSEQEEGEVEYEVYSEAVQGSQPSGELSEEPRVHCQGRGAYVAAQAPERVALERLGERMSRGRMEATQLYEVLEGLGLCYGETHRGVQELELGEGELLARLSLPAGCEQWDEYVLHPSLMDAALQASVAARAVEANSPATPALPVSLGTLRILSRCANPMYAWIRNRRDRAHGQNAIELDVDLCDTDGHICIQMRQLAISLGASAPLDLTVQPQLPSSAARDLEVSTSDRAYPDTAGTVAQPPGRKPAAITLAAPRPLSLDMPPQASAQAGKSRRVSLVDPVAASDPSSAQGKSQELSSPVSLLDRGNGVIAIRVTTTDGLNSLTPELADQLAQVLEHIQRLPSLKVAVLLGTKTAFLQGTRTGITEACLRRLSGTIASFPHPLIAAMEGAATGVGLLVGCLCDLVIGCRHASYSYRGGQMEACPTAAEYRVFEQRFGAALAHTLLLQSTETYGRQLEAMGWTGPIVESAEVESIAYGLAESLAGKPRESMRLLKRHLARELVPLVRALYPVEAAVSRSAAEICAEATETRGSVSTTDFRLSTPCDGVLLATRTGQSDGQSSELTSEGTLLALAELLGQVTRTRSHRCVVLSGDRHRFLPNVPASPQAVQVLQTALAKCAVPVIVDLANGASGLDWLLAQYCDACVYGLESTYSLDAAADQWSHSSLRAAAAAAFAYRFGREFAGEILLTGREYSGRELRERAGTVMVSDGQGALASALQLAQEWTKAETGAVVVARQALLSRMPDEQDGAAAAVSDSRTAPRVSGCVLPRSGVVKTSVPAEGILLVEMQDRTARNAFTPELVTAMEEVFAHIDVTEDYKVVVITGADGHFSCGGTRETLLAIQAGAEKFTDIRLYDIPLRCKLPVIAAMQGHAVGAGWALGMFADLSIFSAESEYISPYMDYGFTPGAGATLALPHKVGRDLAAEILLSARGYTGRSLKSRDSRLTCVARDSVLTVALALAKDIARLPRDRLLHWKERLTGTLLRGLEETYRLELEMHGSTLVGNSEALELIRRRYAQASGDAQDHSTRPTETREQQVAADPRGPRRREPLAAAADFSDIGRGLKALLAHELQMREGDVGEDVQFADLGLDSVIGVVWVRKINERYGIELEATKLYSHSTLRQLSGHVGEAIRRKGGSIGWQQAAATQAPTEVAGAPQARRTHESERGTAIRPRVSRRPKGHGRRWRGTVAADEPGEPIAVIGMAGQFPHARDVEEFWQNIAAGRDCITEVPPQRWDVAAHYRAGEVVAGKTNSRWVGALEDYDRFDPLFFSISPAEAEIMDPQQRLFLQACWQGIEHAGYDAESLSGSKCGVFVGCTAGDYHLRMREQRLSAQGFIGAASSILAARISYFLNLQGPCLAIDTACSSSLVAIAHACDSLRTGASDLALAGGVYVMAGPEMHIKSAQAGMLSGQGRCFTFDQRADGIVLGEAVGVVVLKRLADAEKDRDTIYGLVRGWGVNQDGKTNGITAPNPESQTRLQQEVYRRHRIDPRNIQLIEAHGTGTKLGDPIEVQGLKASFGPRSDKTDYCALGSVKSNIGHCLTAAGVAGFIKLIQALRHRQLPPTIHFERLNEHIELQDGPFYINTRLQDWEPSTGPRQAAINSFGFSGTNAHVVVEEYPELAERQPAEAGSAATRVIVPLSARTSEQLRQRARDLLQFIRRQPQLGLLPTAYTLQVGRRALPERAAFLVGSIGQLVERLEGFLENADAQEGVFRGQVGAGNELARLLSDDDEAREALIERWQAKGLLSRMAEAWSRGMELDWNRLYGTSRPKRIGLPAYPFARERYWSDPSRTDPMPFAGAPAADFHPLLHANTSDFESQRYRSSFTGGEHFLRDHRIRTPEGAIYQVLPGVACLEMVRAALADAIKGWPGSLEIRDVVWLAPITVTTEQDVLVSLAVNKEEEEGEEFVFRISSAHGETAVERCRGLATFGDGSPPDRIDLERLRSGTGRALIRPETIYTEFARRGLLYGPAHQAIAAIYRGPGELLAELSLPPALAGGHGQYVLHPSMLDGALQAVLGLEGEFNRKDGERPVPFALRQLRLLSPCGTHMWARVHQSPGSREGRDVLTVDVDMCNDDGEVCVAMHGVVFRDWKATPLGANSARSDMTSGNTYPPVDKRQLFESELYLDLIESVVSGNISIDDAVSVG